MSVVPRVQHVSWTVQPAPDQKRGRVVRAVVLPRQELERIRSHSQWLADQARDAELRRAQMQHMKGTSEALVKNWKNTVLNKQKERIERRQKRIQDEDDRRNAIYQASLKEAAEDRRKRIEDARRMLLFEKDDIQLVNSAFVFSEVLHERSKQIEFNEHLKQIDEKKKQARADQIKRDIEVYKEEEKNRKEKEHKEKMERKAENIQMMKEKAEREALFLSAEKAHEKQDLLDMEKEIKQVQENIDKEIRRKKEHVMKAALQSLEINKERMKVQKQEDDDEEKVIQIYLKVKQRMECLRKTREAETRQAKHEHQERIRATIAESLKEKENDIDGMIAKALKEREEREAELVKKRLHYEAKLLQERKEYNTAVQEKKRKDDQEEKEFKQWQLMQSLRRDEIDKLHEMKKKESDWATKMRVREGYNKQLEEKKEIRNEQCKEDQLRYQNLISQVEKEDRDFFEYANEVLNECKVGSRPLYPIQKTIHEYRKKHGIINREKYEKWAKEMAELDRRYREEEEQQNRQIAILDEATGSYSPIFSIDIHPDGSRFATGGQGLDSGKVVVWNMAPVINRKAEADENIPKMLCQMDNHEACVNCVRWNHSGRFLASGGDDKLIMIWKINQYSGGNTVFGTGGGIVNVESWRCSATLRGHDGDVLDLAWSTHDAWLASCSVDNTVIVWNALKFPETIAVLKGHTGLVKGVTWDPVGKYLASQSEDRTLRIWRTVDWKEEQVIKEPFEKCSGSTHVLRLNWSPDGDFLVSAHAMNGPGPTAQIIQRDGWTHEMDFVGHRKPVTCVRFNNVLFRRPLSKKASQYSCVCAIGSRDQSISIWLTSLRRPLLVMRDLFANSVLDVSWNSTGHQLMACSWDGTVAYIEFSEEELGKPLTKEEKIFQHEKKYGKSLLSQKDTYVSRVVETPALLQLQDPPESKSDKAAPSGSAGIIEDRRASASSIKGPISKQIETRTSDGRRRITPMFIPSTPDRGDVPQPFSAGTSAQPTFSSAESKSQIVVEKREDVVKPNVAAVKSPIKDGTTPVVNGHAPSIPFQENASEKPTPVPTPFAPVSFGGKRRAEKEKEKPVVAQQSSQAQPSQPTQPKRARFSLERPAPTHSTQDSGPLTGRADGPGIVLPALKVSAKLAVQVESAKLHKEAYWVEVDNSYSVTSSGPLSKLRIVRNSIMPSSTTTLDCKAPSVFWDTVFGCSVIGVVANAAVVCVALEDATVQIMDFKTGWRRIPPLVLSAPASRLSLNMHSFFMVVTASGHMNLWDLTLCRKVVSNESLLPVMNGLSGSQVTLLSCSLSENNIPLVSLSTGKAFTYSIDMGCWLQVGNSRSPVSRNSAHQSFLGNPMSNGAALPLTCLQADIRSCGGSGRILGAAGSNSAGASVSQPCSLAFLDEQLSACIATSSPREYQYWLMTTVRFLVHNGLEERLRLICDDLLGPIHKGASKSKSWENAVMGISKHTLLKDVLNVVATNLRWQRLWTEYTDQLKLLDEMEKCSSSG